MDHTYPVVIQTYIFQIINESPLFIINYLLLFFLKILIYLPNSKLERVVSQFVSTKYNSP